MKKMIAALGLAAFPALVAVAAPALPPGGYLSPGVFDVLAILPPAPRPGDARAKADRAIFKATRAFQGTPRWALAVNDVVEKPAYMFRDFSCAVGIAITPENAPRTALLIRRAAVDTTTQTNAAKAINKRQRPFQIDRGPICQPAQELVDSYDYPSGHTTLGWTMAVLLAEAVPDRATAILARGRAFGDSRIVCGAHNASAVEAGRLSATSTLAAMQGDAAFVADLAAARAEVAALRSVADTPRPDAAACAREAALVAQRIY